MAPEPAQTVQSRLSPPRSRSERCGSTSSTRFVPIRDTTIGVSVLQSPERLGLVRALDQCLEESGRIVDVFRSDVDLRNGLVIDGDLYGA
jgi:hypothetical protein